MGAVLERLRIPIGSLVVDLGMVMMLVYSAGQMTTRFEVMDQRLAAVESRSQAERLNERTALLEQRASQAERDRAEILEALHRIEAKLDSKVDKVR